MTSCQSQEFFINFHKFFFNSALTGASEKADSSGADVLQKALKKAAVQCYAIEGFYPPNVDYMKKHYGIIIDDEKYFVEYKPVAGNIPPSIKVIRAD